jgi:broad specificity phosphatase PhoE
MRLYLVRHGETDYNLQKRYQGRTNTTLNPTGLRQAHLLRRRFLPEALDRIYTSRLIRAGDTARIIASERNVEIRACEYLSEISFGQFEGMTYEEAIKQYPNWKPDGFDFTVCGGESLAQLAWRAQAFCRILTEDSTSSSSIMVVSHAGCLRVLICLLLGLDVDCWWRFSIGPASVSIMDDVPQTPVLTLLNDVSHLKDLKAGGA